MKTNMAYRTQLSECLQNRGLAGLTTSFIFPKETFQLLQPLQNQNLT